MNQKSVVLIALLISAILLSSTFLSLSSGIDTVKARSYWRYHSYTATPSPTPTPSPVAMQTFSSNSGEMNQMVNGIWTQPGDPTRSNCALFAANNVKNIYLQVGDWRSDGSIDLSSHGQTPSMFYASVANAHAAGLKIYAWIIDEGGNVPLTTSGQRATAINNLVNVVKTYGFDGIADDIEIWHPYPTLITYYNEATKALHAIGKEYFTAVIAYWLQEMSPAQIASIHVDRIQPMLYDLWGNYELIFKTTMDKILTHATSTVGLALPSYTPCSWYSPTIKTSMQWVDTQLVSSSTANLAGIDIFWFASTASSEWTAWNDWSTKE